MLKTCHAFKSAPPSSVQMIMRFATQHYFLFCYLRYSFQRVGWLRATSKNISANWKRGFSRWTVTPIRFYSQSRYLGTCAKLMLASTFRDKLRRILGCGSFAPLNVLNQCKKIWFYVLSVSLSLQKTICWRQNSPHVFVVVKLYEKIFPAVPNFCKVWKERDKMWEETFFLVFLSKTGFR
jgi:hypothetical protein